MDAGVGCRGGETTQYVHGVECRGVGTRLGMYTGVGYRGRGRPFGMCTGWSAEVWGHRLVCAQGWGVEVREDCSGGGQR